MTQQTEFNIQSTVATISILSSIMFAIFYFMKLSIFNQSTIEWFFVGSIVSAIIAIASLIIRNIWMGRGY